MTTGKTVRGTGMGGQHCVATIELAREITEIQLLWGMARQHKKSQ